MRKSPDFNFLITQPFEEIIHLIISSRPECIRAFHFESCNDGQPIPVQDAADDPNVPVAKSNGYSTSKRRQSRHIPHRGKGEWYFQPQLAAGPSVPRFEFQIGRLEALRVWLRLPPVRSLPPPVPPNKRAYQP